jgi:hypothetical protein
MEKYLFMKEVLKMQNTKRNIWLRKNIQSKAFNAKE